MKDAFAADFLGAFAIVRRDDRVLFVGNRRTIAGSTVRTWDLPGGRVEPGELVAEALVRELHEETGLQVQGLPQFLFVQEGARVRRGARVQAWRSFFFAVEATGEPVPANEVDAVRWMDRGEMERELTAPYHDSFRRWLDAGGAWFGSEWVD